MFQTVKDVLFFQRRNGEPLRVYMDLEAGRKRSGSEDIFVSYHAKDDVQSTYAGALFHNNRNYHLSREKNNVSILCYSGLLVPYFSFFCFFLFSVTSLLSCSSSNMSTCHDL